MPTNNWGPKRFNEILWLFFLSLLLLVPSQAQTPTPSPTERPKLSISQLEDKLQEIDRRLSEISPSESTNTSATPLDAVPSYIDSLRRYDVSLRRLITLEETRTRLQTRIEEASNAIESLELEGLADPKPYSVLLLDGFQSDLDIAIEKSSSAALSNTAAKTSRDLEAEDLAGLQAMRRRMLDDLSQTSDPSKELDLKRNLEKLELAIESGERSLDLAQTEIEISELELELTGKQIELLNTKITLVQESFRFSKDTLENQFKRLEVNRTALTQRLNDYESALKTARQRLDALLNDNIDDAEQKYEIEARREWLLTHQRKERLTEESLEFNLIQHDLWERRYLVYNNQGTSHFSSWIESARGLLVRLRKNRDILNTELRQIRSMLNELLNPGNSPDETISEEVQSDGSNAWLDLRVEALVARQKALEDALNVGSETESLANRLLAELNRKKVDAPVGERLTQSWVSLVSIWNTELYTLGDSAVTVGKLCIAVTILILGMALVGRLAHLVSDKLLARLPIKPNVRISIERFLRYLFILLVFLFSLHVVNIPLTIFTFLGGSLAIAAGFGAQNILNNFISGLILMVERPVSVGDLIEVDSTIGFVEEIGARSTRIRIPMGIHVIVPNSSLLENKVINWTLRDNKIRTSVSVGVAYGSPTRKVMELINEACLVTEAVLKLPAPVVMFDDFGDSSLNFTVHFWTRVDSPLDRDRVETSIRLLIDDLFTEHKIIIPFPQRDLNFNETVPVRIVQENEPQKNNDTKS